MGAENWFLDNVPLFIIAIAFLSYILWSKFFNKRKLYPVDIESLLDFLCTFIISFIILCGAAVLFAIVIPSILMKLDPQQIEKTFPAYIITIVVYMLLAFIVISKKHHNKKDLYSLLNKILLVYIVLSLISFALPIAPWLSNMPSNLVNAALMVPFILISTSVLVILFSLRLFPKYKIDFNLKSIIYVLISFFVLLIILTFLLPKTSLVSEKTIEHHIIHPLEANKIMQIDHSLDRYGFLNWFSIKHGPFFNREEIKSFYILYKKTIDNKSYNYSEELSLKSNVNSEEGVTELKWDNENTYLIVLYDKKIMKNLNTYGFKLKGVKRVNLTPEEFYINSTAIDCMGKNCRINLTIKNKLESRLSCRDCFLKPVGRDWFTDKGCKTINVSGYEIRNNWRDTGNPRLFNVSWHCDSGSNDPYCNLENSNADFSMMFTESKIKWLEPENFYMEKDSEVYLTFELNCT